MLFELAKLRVDLFFVESEHLLVLLFLELLVHGLEGHLVVEAVNLLSDLSFGHADEVGSGGSHGGFSLQAGQGGFLLFDRPGFG